MIALARKLSVGLLKAAVAPFASLGRGVMAGGAVTWMVHAILLVAVLVGLWALGAWLELDKAVRAPSQALRELWLPLMFLLTYGLAWVGVWTWRALREPGAATPFPEIDRAWRQACVQMQRRGVELLDTPLVLVLGEPSAREGELLAALELAPTFGPTPSASDSPLRVLADEEAVYVVCHDVSLLSLCADRLAQQRMLNRHRRPQPAAQEKNIPAPLRVQAAAPAAPSGETAAPFDGAWDYGPGAPLEAEHAAADDWRPLLSPAEAAECADRLAHLMRLIARDREPVAPLTGVALLVPCDAADNDRAADAAADAIAQDLDTIAHAGGGRGPVVTVLTDLQHTPGCGRLLHALPAERKRRRFGVELPVGSLDSEEELRRAVDWLSNTMAPALCQRLFQIDPQGDTPEVDIQENAALFDFQRRVAERAPRLQEALSRGLAGGDAQPWPLLGCYMVAAGDAIGGSRAFGAGVMQTLVARADLAQWTDEALAEDAARNRLVTYGYAGLAAAVVAAGGLLMVGG